MIGAGNEVSEDENTGIDSFYGKIQFCSRL